MTLDYAGPLVFGVDIDSTMYDFQALARRVAIDMALDSREETERKKLWEVANAPWPEWRSPDDLFGHDLWMRVLNNAHSPEMILRQDPFENSVEIVNRLKEQGHEVFFVSSRDHDETAEATEEWLKNIGIQDPKLFCTGRSGSKIPTLLMYGTNVLIDDRPQTLIDYAYDPVSEFVAAIGISHQYNRALSDIPRIDIVDGWRDIPDVLETRTELAFSF